MRAAVHWSNHLSFWLLPIVWPVRIRITLKYELVTGTHRCVRPQFFILQNINCNFLSFGRQTMRYFRIKRALYVKLWFIMNTVQAAYTTILHCCSSTHRLELPKMSIPCACRRRTQFSMAADALCPAGAKIVSVKKANTKWFWNVSNCRPYLMIFVSKNCASHDWANISICTTVSFALAVNVVTTRAKVMAAHH